jgi:leucyl-tRNA synthetase
MSEKKTWKKDELAADEERIRANWDENPMSSFSSTDRTVLPGEGELYTFPYPYSNGELHLGHGFTSVFYDAMARHARLRGVPVTQSFSYHLTGMPIVAAAYRLEKEYESYDSGDSGALTRKEGEKPTQFSTMLMMGITESEIRKFVDPNYWADYFPDVSREVVRRFGIASDNSKSFITTEKNPYYDAFARWHFQKLFQTKRLVFGKRHSLYSITDGQPCLGHERSEGEDASPAKFSLIKFYLDQSSKNLSDFTATHKLDEKAEVYLIGLTMRPETLVGLTNVWIDADHRYRMYRFGFVDQEDRDAKPIIEYWVMQKKNRLNLQYQWVGPDNPFDPVSLYYEDCGEIQGSTFVNTSVIIGDTQVPVWAMDFHSSDCYKEARDATKVVTPDGQKVKGKSCINSHLRINTAKGTGIVGSVPSDSPIDYLGYMYKKVYEYQDGSWDTISNEIEPIIRVDHPEYSGDRVARDLIEARLHSSIKNKIPVITEADMTYIKEFCYHSSISSQKMIEDYDDMSMIEVRDAIEKCWNEFHCPLLYTYYESDSRAISRTGDELIVALMDQWFIDYSDPTWKRDSLAHVDTMKLFDEVAEERIRYAINWLQQWPCSRTCGLGTRIPLSIVQSVDQSIVSESECPLIDSLSDSTIYMCMYTIYDMMQRFDPSEFTEEVFDYIFLLKNMDDPIMSRFSELRDSFLAFYPVDLRVSGKDLINNHLAMCIMNHAAVWDSEFMERYRKFTGSTLQSFGPRAYRINGFITVAKKDKAKKGKQKLAEKMSKSKGNFKTLNQAIDAYAADPLRFTFCSANLGTSDAYFDQDLATRTVEKLHKEREFILAYCRQIREYEPHNNESSTSYEEIKQLLSNEMALIIRNAVEAYGRSDVRTVIHNSYHMLLNMRDTYVKLLGYHDTLRPENRGMMAKFFMTFVTLMYPIIPHFSENIHQNDDYQFMLNADLQDMFHQGSDSIFYYLDECYNYIASTRVPSNSEELRFQYEIVTGTASEISSRHASYIKRKIGVESIDVYCLTPSFVPNSVDQTCFEIMDEVGFIGEETDKAVVIPKIKVVIQKDPTAGKNKNMNKRMGDIIREYRRIEDLYLNYRSIFDEIRTEYSIHTILEQMLREFLKQSEVDCEIRIHEVTVETEDIDSEKIIFCQPLVVYHHSKE